MIKKFFIVLFCCSISIASFAQNIAQTKKELQETPDPIGYVKFKLKKGYRIDTVSIISTTSFLGIEDSLAYYGKVGNVYGPFKKAKYLIKILGKAPNTFYHVSHILLDTSVFRPKFADPLADKIIKKITSGESTFESMAHTYSSDYISAAKGGDLGWFSSGAMLPQLEQAIEQHKKGDVFKVWTPAGLHIVTIIDSPKKDTGFALMLRVIL